MIKLMIADDQPLIKELTMVLQDEKTIQVIGTACNGNELLEMVAKELPDVVITDIKMTEMDGIEATKLLRELYLDVRIIGLTMHEDDELLIDMLEAGADGYILKCFGKEEIVEAITAVLANGMYFCDSTLPKVLKRIARSRIEWRIQKEAAKFSEFEIQVMQLICRQFSIKEIADHLKVSHHTVESCRNRLFIKACVKNIAGIAVYATMYGLYDPWAKPQ